MPTYLLVSVGHFKRRSGCAPEHHQKNRFNFSMEQERKYADHYYDVREIFTKSNAAPSNCTPNSFGWSQPRCCSLLNIGCPKINFRGRSFAPCRWNVLFFQCILSRMKTEVGQMGIAISEASAEDAEALERLINSAYRGASALQGWSTEAELIDGTRTDAELIREIINDTSAVLLKAVSDSSIVGCVELRLEGDRLYLGMLTVRPDLQSQGIGKELLRVSEAEAKRWGCRTIFMTVLTVRKLLIDWYLRHGYRDTGERKPFAFTDPRYGKPRMPLEFAVLEKQLN